MKLNRTKKGFTIVELVIVIAVIGVLSAILIPTFANLTNDARAAANKQQVADAYTAYLVEAVNDKYDGLYTRSGTEAPYTYTDANITIAQKAQNKIAIDLNGTWYTYDSEKGWNIPTEAPTSPTLVCAPFTSADPTAYYENNGTTAKFSSTGTAGNEAANKAISTFNGAILYYVA